jgi:hypothetical protein
VKNMTRQNGEGPIWGGGRGAGWGMGPCGAGMHHGWHNGMGGCGFGFRRFYSPKNEVVALEEEQQILEEGLQAIKEEIIALKGQRK